MASAFTSATLTPTSLTPPHSANETSVFAAALTTGATFTTAHPLFAAWATLLSRAAWAATLAAVTGAFRATGATIALSRPAAADCPAQCARGDTDHAAPATIATTFTAGAASFTPDTAVTAIFAVAAVAATPSSTSFTTATAAIAAVAATAAIAAPATLHADGLLSGRQLPPDRSRPHRQQPHDHHQLHGRVRWLPLHDDREWQRVQVRQ